MKTKPKQSRIMRDMHEGAKDLYELGLISYRQMGTMDALCRAPKPNVPGYSVSKSVREALAKASHAVRRSTIPVSPHDAAALLALMGEAGTAAAPDARLAARS